MAALSPFQLLEINLISAQDLAKVSRSMRTYAMAWVHPDRKLTTRVDTHGGTNPTWNDKFVFRVDNQFLQSDTSAIMIEIYALHWFRDVHVGTVRVLVGNLIPPQTRNHNLNHIGMRFVALQVRRPSGRPQGILNAGVTLLDSTMRSMPLYTQLSTSAVGYQTLMGQDDLLSHRHGSSIKDSAIVKLRRTKSEKSSILEKDEIREKPNSIGSDSNSTKKLGKVIYDKPLSIVDGAKAESVLSYASSYTKRNGKRLNKKPSSIISRSDLGVPPLLRTEIKGKANDESKSTYKHNWLPPPIDNNNNNNNNHNKKQQITGDNNNKKANNNRKYPITKDFAAGSVWSESEVGPSPSEVAAAIAEDSKYRKFDDGGSSLLYDNWSVEESEGVRTKLERWRKEMPAVYDDSRTSGSRSSSIFPATRHPRRHTDAGGKFSCFGNICGFECSIVCGANNNGGNNNTTTTKKATTTTRRVQRVPSIDSVSTYF